VFVSHGIEEAAPGALGDERLADEITTLAAHLSAAMARWLALVAVFDQRGVWAQWGCKSCAHWLGWRCSIAPSAAREHVRVARCLTRLPLIQAAFAQGELSYSKVRALTRLGAIEDEAALVELALVHTAAQLEDVIRATRRVSREEAQDAYDERYLELDPGEDGSVTLRARLTAEDAAVLQRALDVALESLREAGVDRQVTGANLRADALVRIADSVLATGVEGRPVGARHEVIVHVDAELLSDEPRSATASAPDDTAARTAGVPAGTCALHGDVPIAVQTARRLCCDAGIVVALERGGEPLAIGRRTRSIPPAIRRALLSRDRCCRFPGCTSTGWLDAHHIKHWADGGSTDLENLVLLCGHHHKLVHEHGYRVEVAGTNGGEARGERFRGNTRSRRDRRGRPHELCFSTPHGRPLEHAPTSPAGDTHALLAAHHAAGITPGPETAVPGWAGERLDLGLSVDAFLNKLATPPNDNEPPPPNAAALG